MPAYRVKGAMRESGEDITENIDAPNTTALETECRRRGILISSIEVVPEMVWRGEMVCRECGYRWQARRNTPPAKCPSCSKKGVAPVMVPKGTGCAAMLLVFILGAVVLVIR